MLAHPWDWGTDWTGDVTCDYRGGVKSIWFHIPWEEPITGRGLSSLIPVLGLCQIFSHWQTRTGTALGGVSTNALPVGLSGLSPGVSRVQPTVTSLVIRVHLSVLLAENQSDMLLGCVTLYHLSHRWKAQESPTLCSQ